MTGNPIRTTLFVTGVMIASSSLLIGHRSDGIVRAAERLEKIEARPVRGYDTHVHLDGRYREGGEWLTDFLAPAATGLDSMNAVGVGVSLIMPPPFHPETALEPKAYDYTELLPVVGAHPQRFAVGGGGYALNPMIHKIPAEEVTSTHLEEFRRRAEEIVSAGAAAFGEMTALHLSFFEGHEFMEVSPSHPLFLLLAEISAEFGIPIDLHMEAVEEDLELRSLFGPPNPQAPDVVHANLDSLEVLLNHAPNARIVWAHVGWDNTGDMTVGVLRDLLERNDNLFCALKLLGTAGKQIAENRPLDEHGVLRPEWRALIEDHPTRFVVGGDEFYGIPGKTPLRPPSTRWTWLLLNELSDELARQIAVKNPRAIYRLGS